jgi:hypothetical protein
MKSKKPEFLKKKKLKVNKDERSSYFVLDLKNDFADETPVVIKKRRITFEEKAVAVSEGLHKGIGYIKNLRNRKTVAENSSFAKATEDKPFFAKTAPSSRGFGATESELEGNLKIKEGYRVDEVLANKFSRFENYSKKIDEFALLSLAKLLVLAAIIGAKLVYKTSYKVGIFFISGLKFLFFSFLLLTRWIIILFKFLGRFIFGQHFMTSRFMDRQIMNLKIFLVRFRGNFRFFCDVIRSNLNISSLRMVGLADAPAIINKEKAIKKIKEDYSYINLEELGPSEVFSYKSAVRFAVVLLIIILPFKAFTAYKNLDFSDLKGRVLGASEKAMVNLEEATNSFSSNNFEDASQSFSNASQSFLQAESEIKDINDIFFSFLKIIPNDEARFASEGKKILSAGAIASNLGSELSLAINSFFSDNKNLIEAIDEFGIHGREAVKNIDELSSILKTINLNNLPEEYRDQFALIKSKIEGVSGGLQEFIDLTGDIKEFLGKTYDKRYLLVFQNNTEMRATGGFIGSYALVDFSNGKLKNLEVPGGGSYDTEGGMTVLEKAPEPLSLVNPLWHFWDANWWPDWPKSAKKLMWFYDKSGGPTVDGVISFTPTVIENLLRIIGPIDMQAGYGVVLDSENFWEVTQAIVENEDTIYQGPDVKSKVKSKTPKKLIGDLMQKILEELPKRLDREKLVKILASIEGDLNQKHALFYFTDNNLQSKIESLGWDGGLVDFKWDYLSVVNTNIAGGKSDKKVDEKINLSSEVGEDGSIINTLEITRIHTGIKNELFSGVRNVNWIRVYVPEGSELIEATGFVKPDDVYFEKADEGWQEDQDLDNEEKLFSKHDPDNTKTYKESGKTVFANWSMVDPGESVVIKIKYRLPMKLASAPKNEDDLMNKIQTVINSEKKDLMPYGVYFQKQSGSIGSQFEYSLNLPVDKNIIGVYPVGTNEAKNNFKYSGQLSADSYFAILVEKNK